MFAKKGNKYITIKDNHSGFDILFSKTYGKYPANDSDRKQFMDYLKYKKRTKKLDLMFEKI